MATYSQNRQKFHREEFIYAERQRVEQSLDEMEVH